MHWLFLLSLLPLLLAQDSSELVLEGAWDKLPSHDHPYFPLEAVLPTLASRSDEVSNITKFQQLQSRALLEHAGRSQLSLSNLLLGHQPDHQLHRRQVKEKRGKGEGSRGQMRTVKRSLTCSTTHSSSTGTKKAGTTAQTSMTTTAKAGTTSHTTTTKGQKTTTTTTAKSTPTVKSSNSITVDPQGVGPFSGWGTWFDDGLGACGWKNKPGDPIVAVSHILFDNWPGYTGLNPNNNPICGKHLAITWGGKTVVAEVTDMCPGCDVRSLDMSKGLFEQFATLDVGLLGMASYTGNITWSWVQGSGSLPALPVS